MSDTEPARLRRRGPTRAESLRIVVTILVFTVLGPLLGGAGAILGIALLIAIGGFIGGIGTGEFDPVRLLGSAVTMVRAIVIVGGSLIYLVGVPPAAVAGAVIVIRNLYFGGAGARFVALTGAVLGFGATLWFFGGRFSLSLTPLVLGAIVAVTGALSALACWRLTGGRLAPPPSRP